MPEIAADPSSQADTALTWDRDHTAQLVKVQGQVLTVDMSQADSAEFNLTRDVHDAGVTPGGALIRELGDMMTVTLTIRVKADAVTWEDAGHAVGQDEEG